MPRRILEGRVVSDKMDKTVTVLIERRYMHPLYKKYVRRTDKFAAHDETNACKEGDFVRIEECRPISRNKSWTVITDKKGAQKAAPKSDEKETKAAPKKETAKKDDKKPATKKPAAKKTAAKKTAAKK